MNGAHIMVYRKDAEADRANSFVPYLDSYPWTPVTDDRFSPYPRPFILPRQTNLRELLLSETGRPKTA